MGRFLCLVFCCIICSYCSLAQQNTIEHTIKKGQTVYSISRDYGVSVQSIFDLNPGSRDIIYAGGTLIIPKTTKSSKPITSSNNDDIINYTVVRGDTKLSLSKKFGISICSLELQNPKIVDMLQAGHNLKIDPNFTGEKISTEIIEHRVDKGETLWGIAKDNSICLNALIAANKDRLSDVLMAGQKLRIPGKNCSFTIKGLYIVQKGDTKFGLAKLFNTDIASLEANNPQIKDMLMAGHRIKIDGEASNNDATTVATTSENNPEIETEQSETAVAEVKTEEVETVTESETEPLNKPEPQIETETEAGVESETDVIVETPIEEEVVQEEEEEEEEEEAIVEEEVIIEDKKENVAEAQEPEKFDIIEENENTETVSEDIIEDTSPETPLPNTQETTTDDDLYMDYIIQPNETLFGLSRKAGLSMDQFMDLNPELKNGVIEGALIKMPKNPIASRNQSDGSGDSNNALGNNNLVSNINPTKSIELYFYLPFSQREFNERTIDSTNTASPDSAKRALEFYEGATIALDSARALGISFDVALINSHEASEIKMDRPGERSSVIMPFFQGDNYPKIISDGPTSIINISSNYPATNGNAVYEALPSERDQQLKMLNHINSVDSNVVVVSDLEGTDNLNLVSKIIPTATSLKVDNAGFFEDDVLEAALDKDRLNYIILDTDKTIVFLNTTTTLMGKLSRYNIQLALLGMSRLPSEGQVSKIRFRILKLTYPSILTSETSKNLITFNTNYERLFNKEASETAISGFDTTFDILLRMSQNDSLESTIKQTSTEHLRMRFDYQKTTERSYQNNGIYILQYNADDTIIEID
ncbi:LysM peptidoglycan-binding domain-containing protein [Sediminibacter sp. Hel_I_10]|uniref:muramidase family protein n=1 Tax=Sediminibacter sp. Hel_I_10 TaxID=1392490 RepID=UPI00047D516D|nr:LysM peptidoglycan-binding domain-containing protein [Sediminibacter sp. Hel_I_10]